MITTQRELRRQFWADHPELSREKIKNYNGTGRMYPTDTRCAWCDWLDAMKKDGQISDALASRACLD